MVILMCGHLGGEELEYVPDQLLVGLAAPRPPVPGEAVLEAGVPRARARHRVYHLELI